MHLSSTALLAIGDDHEIYNDFDANVTDPRFATANQAYSDYLGAANPDPIEPGTNYYEFRHGDAAFFVWDTRAYRSPDGVSRARGLAVGSAQASSSVPRIAGRCLCCPCGCR